jgi:hypothetical protein
MDSENLYDKLREIKADGSHKINILQESIDVGLQMAYFRLTSRIKKKLDREADHLINVTQLYDPEVEIATKKRLLCILASIDKPEYFRAIEQFKENAPEELKEWTILAEQESKMLLESTLLETKLLYISTGLGGKGGALRFFLVLMGKDNAHYQQSQTEIIKKEFDFYFRQHNGEIEEMFFDGQYARVVCLLPLDCNIGDVVKNAIKECNTYGNFIEENFLLTNVKKLDIDEIEQFLVKVKNSGNEDFSSEEIDLGSSSEE